MDTKYKVLKKYGEYKKGEILDPQEAFEGTPEEIDAEIAGAIEKGFIEPVEGAGDADKDPDPAAPEKASSKKAAVTVFWNGGSREYSREVHGDDFESLAEAFAKKFKGTIA